MPVQIEESQGGVRCLLSRRLESSKLYRVYLAIIWTCLDMKGE